MFEFLGLVAPIIFFILWGIAVFNDKDWRFGDNYISDHGISEYKVTRVAFNCGCILVGALFVIFGTDLLINRSYDIIHCITWILAIIAGISMVFVGIFTENDMKKHLVAAMTLFLTAFALVISLAVIDLRNGYFITTVLTILAFILSLMTYRLTNVKGLEVIFTASMMIIVMVQYFQETFD